MKLQSILEGLVLSAPLVFLGADFNSSTSNSVPKINNVSTSTKDYQNDSLNRFKFFVGSTIVEGLFLYMGYQAIRKSLEYRK
ncbi:MAG: hypothetical protein WC979_05955 [Candidatus Pacearchaeota archaeon]|jgi:hypothetical protein